MSVYRYKNSKVWWMDFIFDGVRIREWTKSRAKKLAEEIERKRRSDLEGGHFGLKKRDRPRLFSLVAEDYLTLKKPVLSDRSLTIEKANLRHLLRALGGKLLSDIDAGEIASYQRERLQAGAAPKTINLEIGTLRAILLRHQLWAFIRQDVRMLKVDEGVGRRLSLAEEGRLLSACAESRSRALYPAVVLALNTGMRSIEIRSLRWGQIDLASRTVRVGRSKTESGAGRTMPLNLRATAALRDWAGNLTQVQPVDHVFPSERYGQNGSAYATDPSKPMGSFKEGWEAARKRSAVQCRFHDLRHTACTRLLEGGVPFALLAQIMGWSASSTVKMAKRYGHIGDDSLRHAMAVLDRGGSAALIPVEEIPGVAERESMTEKSPDKRKIA
jgi:integrase